MRIYEQQQGPSAFHEEKDVYSRHDDKELFEVVFSIPVSHEGAAYFWELGSSIIQPGWEEVFSRFPDHLHWLVAEVIEPLMSGFTSRCPAHYNHARQYTWDLILETAQELGPQKYVRRPHPYGAIGDGRPRPGTGPASSSPSPAEATTSPPLHHLTYQELVVSSVPDIIEEEPSRPSSPSCLGEDTHSPPPQAYQDMVATFAPDERNENYTASSDYYQATDIYPERTHDFSPSNIGPDYYCSTPPSR
ncbi:hypothetical protein FPOAC2_09224 [Fusarium poae]|uniref:Uncharacterized protein n=1 Tax=Fusarium poae TaxID=36050 RepID=A0A1B8ANF4_FUSPO|nr:hypothetical protein FPOAC1_009282 [Fusarium poae]KAG8669882.1 hypothetical protein FPOAC1_009282 [Fusarium poae]OBS22093.1 hypothetical protein FPOA_08430 [Fusarium poae]